LFASLAKDQQAKERIDESQGNVFAYVKDGVKKLYRHKCVSCGACCDGKFDITIRAADAERWDKEGRQDILDEIQIMPESLAPGRRFGMGLSDPPTKEEFADMPDGSIDGIPKFIRRHEGYFLDLIEFIEENHEMVDDGASFMQLPHWFMKDAFMRAIFRPTTFGAILEGLKRNIEYFFTNEIHKNRLCPFLMENNLCAIHKTKPEVCKEYPVKSYFESEPEAFEGSLSFCKGFKLIRNT
jgi:Fe-S-cluster containining protein